MSDSESDEFPETAALTADPGADSRKDSALEPVVQPTSRKVYTTGRATCTGRTARHLAKHPAFAKCSRHQLARLMARSSVRSVQPGQYVYEAGDPASAIYYVLDGPVSLRINDREVSQVPDDLFGEECIAQGESYVASAVATSDLTVLRIPKQDVLAISEDVPSVAMRLHDSLLNHYTEDRFNQLSTIRQTRKKTKVERPAFQTVGWMLASLLPITLFFTLPESLSPQLINYLTVFSAAIIMWMFRLVPEFIPALLVVSSALILEVVPAGEILSGFSSGSFIMALSVFGISALLVRSGLTYRLALTLLSRCPRKQWAHELLMMFVGLLLTPVLPSANGRVTIVTPLLQDIGDTMGYERGGAAMTRLAAAGFAGISLFSACILTSKSINFAVFDLLPTQEQVQFSWGYWFIAASVAGAVLFAGHLAFSQVIFRNKEVIKGKSRRLQTQLEVLGRLTPAEWLAVGATGLFILGIITSSLTKISPPWIGLAVLVLIGLVGALSKGGVKKDIDWAFLLMLAGMISIAKTLSYLGLDKMMMDYLGFLGHYLNTDLPMFIICFAGIMAVIRVVLPSNAAIVLSCIVFFPIAEHAGVGAWPLAFMILLLSDTWIMAYQCTYYMAFRDQCIDNDACPYDERRFARYNMMMLAVRLLAIFATLPYWRSMGLL